MQYIEIENIKNSYTVGSETIEVLAGISFAGGQGEFVVVTGLPAAENLRCCIMPDLYMQRRKRGRK